MLIVWFIYRSDQYDREGWWPLTLSFLLGMLVTLPVIKIQQWFYEQGWENTSTVFHALFVAYILVALTEELLKYLVLLFYPYRQRFFDEPLDGIVYAVMISMGFATLENILYAFQFGIPTTAIRGLTAVPAHAAFAVIMGYYVGKSKFRPERRQRLLLRGLLIPIAVHGLYDFFILQEVYDYLILLAVITLSISLYFALQMIREQRENSPFRPPTDDIP